MAGRIIKVAGLVVLAAALSAPLASAKPYTGDEGGSLSGQPTQYLTTPALDQGMQSTTVAPNDRPGTRGIGQASGSANGATAQFSGAPPRPDDRAGVRPSVPTSVPSSFAAPVSTGNDFNWGTAGIGAAGLAALALAIGLLVALGRRSRGHEDVAVS